VAGLVALGLLFGLVGGSCWARWPSPTGPLTAYERLGAAIGVADAQVLLPAAHTHRLRPVATMPGRDRELDTGRLDRPDQHPGRPVRLAQRRPRPPAGPRRAGRDRGRAPRADAADEILVSEPAAADLGLTSATR
jgi:hypothetical protein